METLPCIVNTDPEDHVFKMVAAMTFSRPCPSVRCPASQSAFRSARPALAARAPRTQRLARFTTRAVDEKQVLEDVRGIIAEQLGKDLKVVTADAKFVDLGADSLDTVEIMMALEETFDLQLDEEGAEKIATVQDAADLIAQQISEA